MLASVNDVFNACLVRGDMTGDVLLYGKGAGGSATASAVVGDIIDCADNREKRKVFGWNEPKKDFVENYLKVPTALYVRVKGGEKEKEKVLSAFENADILEDKEKGEFVFITEKKEEGALRELLSSLGLEIASTFRVTDY